jgi:hypothetical protein
VNSQDPSHTTRSRSNVPSELPKGRPQAADLDTLIAMYQERKARAARDPDPKPDPIEKLRTQMMSELIPTFNAVAVKYAPAGFTMRLDAMDFLAGQRELRLDLTFGDARHELIGTITPEFIAFQEVHYEGDVTGQIRSGPSIRLRTLTADGFRDFLCERLAMMVRTALRRCPNLPPA